MLRYFWPSDDEQLAGQWNDSHFDEDASWWVGPQRAGATVALATAVTLTALSTAVATNVFNQWQDDPAGNLTNQPAVQEEYWINPVAPAVWLQPSVITDDDVHPTFVTVFTPDDGDWKPIVPPSADTYFIRLPFLDPEEIPQLPAAVNPNDGSDIWTPQSPPWDPNWTLLFFLDDGSAVPVFEPDEDFLPAQALPVPYNWPQPAQPFDTPDDDFQVPEFVAAEDPIWQPLVQPVPASNLWPQPFTFEQNEQAANLVAFTDEIFWQNPTPPVPDSLWVLRQDLFDEQVPAGNLTLVLDDSFYALNIPGPPFPDPGSLRQLQQWTFEQNEPAGSLRNTVDEDFWVNPVPAVNWPQPSVFVFDELPGHIPSTGQDEDFWNLLVPPIAATNYISLPYGCGFSLSDPEEIPAGNLFVPIPPPVVPCTPPLGFDKDTTINYFGGNKNPTQALFCRICNSGKPLLVRGDYAIWCQDCCAFVSKSDTMMGTVRAPGKFKAIF